jgi:BirA family biotin operon repressor/biotin-[acetyl-CoA-carboxylase] ligase
MQRNPWIDALDTVTSTNDVVRGRLEQDAPHGTAVTARAQTAGRGRHGRVWHSPPDASLYLSIGLRQPGIATWLPLVPLVAADAVAEAVAALAGVDAGIKWPNDLLVGDRKLSGILCEALARDGRIHAAVVGIGVNLTLRAEDVPDDLRGRTISLLEASGQTVAPETLAAAIHRRLLEGVAALASGAVAPILDRVRRRDVTLGRVVGWESVAGRQQGRALGIAADGALRVEVAGAEIQVRSGEVVVVDVAD